MIELGSMVEHFHEEIDELFIQIKRDLAKMTKSDPETAEELYRLVCRLEDWIDPLVIDSIKLRTLEKKLKDIFEITRRIGVITDKKPAAL